MKRQYVNTLQEGDHVNDYFVASRKDLRLKQDGGKFLGMVFKDRTGEIGGVLWNNATDTAKLFEPGDVVTVRGVVGVFQGRLQIRVETVLPMRADEYAV
ncbi:MAG TPA: OB-fold nucleic acid binding domain-containing protein, partial [Candidatus Hydrogenedentes bacterium]|nr:OB-fold nucleic acid binding domain-containing protein [Candidatus Hydrogenedentota bacterium]